MEDIANIGRKFSSCESKEESVILESGYGISCHLGVNNKSLNNSSDVPYASSEYGTISPNYSDEDSPEDDLSLSDDEGNYDDIDEFIKDHISCLFDPSCEISFEDKSKFGELMREPGARLSYAKYMDAHRSKVKCVDETTFYKLLHSFALVLFECGKADDYRAAKTLMNMAFTYYCFPHINLNLQKTSSCSALNETDENEVKEPPKAKWKSNSFQKFLVKEKLRKEWEGIQQRVKINPSIQKLKRRVRRRPKKQAQELVTKDDTPDIRQASECTFTDFHPDFFSQSKRLFLYERLKYQPIWKSLRFWNEAFLIAVHDDRKRSCPANGWSNLTPEERESTNTAIVNITFCQLLTFINNMKCLGLSNETCFAFLKKHSVIGGLAEGGEHHQILLEKITKP